MKKSIKSKLSQIDSEDFNYSHVGEASTQQFLYLLEKKKDIDNLYENKKVVKEESKSFINEKDKDKDLYDDVFDKGEYEDDIFNKSYEAKYQKELNEKKLKYPQPRNSCSFIDINDKTKSKNKKNKKIQEKKSKDETKEQKEDLENKLKYELGNERYKYHLIHHHHDYIINSKSIYNPYEQVSRNSYKPKLEFLFKKIIYSPEFNKMSGRYDQENKKDKIENKIDKILKSQKQKDFIKYQKKLKKIRNLKLIPLPKNDSEENFFQFKKPLKKFRTIGDNIEIKKLDSGNNFRRNSIENGENSETRNGISNLGKRNNSVLMNEHQIISFNIKENNNDKLNMQNIEDENDKNSYNIYEEKKNVSNNLNENNTLSTINQNKTISDKKKNSNFETEIIYPNISKNDSNILIHNNYSDQFKRKKSYNTLSNINYLISSKKTEQSNNSNQQGSNYILLNKNFDYKNKVVNFEKMLSREYINKLQKKQNNVYDSLSPNYDAIRPKCVMKVIYARKYNNKKFRKKEFLSDYNQIVFNIDKHYNNYNNHFPPKNIYLGKFTGRKTDSILPSYMLDQNNRSSFNSFNEKSLKMNNFANGEYLGQMSSFNQKRSFNCKLNEQYTGNDPDNIEQEISTLFRRITKYPISNKKYNYGELRSNSSSTSEIQRNKFGKYIQRIPMKTTKIPEYYQVNLDKYGKYRFSCGEKIDGFTLKTIKSSKSSIDLLSDYEKKIFLSKLDE